MDEAPEGKKSMKGLLLLAVFLAGVGAVAGVAIILSNTGQTTADDAGFNMTETGAGAAPAPAAQPAAPQGPDSSLGMISTQGMDLKAPGQKPAQADRSLEDTITRICRENELRVQALSNKYSAKHPAIVRYAREWMSHPDLKQLNDDYMRDHDPIKFMKGLVGSKSFIPLIRKYATEPAIHQYALEIVKNAPQEMMSSVTAYMAKDKPVGTLVDNVLSTAGFPPHILGGGAHVGQQAEQKGLLESAAQSGGQLGQPAQKPR
ncbi:MAG: hypothetical protein HY927_05505 [Elusimicrobia bacterium]|nr:hypothetical protein [Elusimicrobiota bacterium]